MLPPVPAILAGVVELAYLACYPLVPVSFSVVWLYGSAADVGRFWAAVLLSGYACYATLPWLVSRPPRLVDGHRADSGRGIAGVNVLVLGRLSHQFNTFPSGHVAVSAAASVIVASVSGVAGAALGAVTAAICVGAASGRYHYVIDVLLGLAVAAAAVAVAVVV
jgi:membrane-associated phospholipid phosphatase